MINKNHLNNLINDGNGGGEIFFSRAQSPLLAEFAANAIFFNLKSIMVIIYLKLISPTVYVTNNPIVYTKYHTQAPVLSNQYRGIFFACGKKSIIGGKNLLSRKGEIYARD